MFAFRFDVAVGDALFSPVLVSSTFWVGRVVGDYQWSSEPVVSTHHHWRPVIWAGPFPQAILGVGPQPFRGYRYTLGSRSPIT
ncbi:MAG: hypothetical protein LC713_07415 [Actinobacteria bacterium]|nr:hypothetical protein [Actinomycetota bacterium]